MFYERIKRICDEKSVKITHLLTDLGLSTGNLAKWKKGVVPKSATLERIADYLGVSVDALLGKEKPADQDGNGLSPAEQELIDLFDRVPEDKQELVLQQVEAALRLAGLLDE